MDTVGEKIENMKNDFRIEQTNGSHVIRNLFNDLT